MTRINLFLGKWLFCLCALQAAEGCNSRPSDILSVDEMKVILTHHAMSEEFLTNFVVQNPSLRFDSVQNMVYRQVLSLHNIDSATFYRSLAWYQSDLDRLRILLDSANNYAMREREKRYQAPAVGVTDSTSNTADSTIEKQDQ